MHENVAVRTPQLLVRPPVPFGVSAIRVLPVMRFMVYFAVLLLFLPKFNFVSIEGFRAGLRIDDIVIAGVVMVLMFAGWVAPVFRSRVFVWGAAFVATSLVSHLMGGHVLFSLRMLEYLSVAIIGYAYGSIVKKPIALDVLLFVYLIISVVLCALQSAGLVGGIGIGGFTSEFGDRAFGLCNGPWELGIVVCFIFGYLIQSEWVHEKYWRVGVLYASSFITLIFTAARTPIAIFLMVVLFALTRRLPSAIRYIVRIGLPVLVFIILYAGVWMIETDNFAVIRLREFLNPNNLEDLYQYAVNFRPSVSYVDTTGEELTRYKEAGMDPSMAIRLNIFSYLVSNYYMGGPVAWMLGIGHGEAGPSTDMGVVRIFAEVGLIGFVCFHAMLYAAYRRLPRMELIVVAFVINQLTLDVYVGYKTMFVFFLIAGYEFAMRRRLAPVAFRPVRPAAHKEGPP
jgi:hypothetical protein